jgi:hypothetical protein
VSLTVSLPQLRDKDRFLNFENVITGNRQDFVTGNSKRNTIHTYGGNDTINIRDGHGGDVGNCGTGKDTAIIDRNDRTVGCEKVRKPRKKKKGK